MARAHVSSSPIIQAAASYETGRGTYVVLSGNSGQLVAFRITATAPPIIATAWATNSGGRGSPFVTSTDGDTGAVVFSGGGANELMAGTRRFNTGIAARGRIYVANDNKVCAFTVPVPPIDLAGTTLQAGGMIQFGFTNISGLSFTAIAATNLLTRPQTGPG